MSNQDYQKYSWAQQKTVLWTEQTRTQQISLPIKARVSQTLARLILRECEGTALSLRSFVTVRRHKQTQPLFSEAARSHTHACTRTYTSQHTHTLTHSHPHTPVTRTQNSCARTYTHTLTLTLTHTHTQHADPLPTLQSAAEHTRTDTHTSSCSHLTTSDLASCCSGPILNHFTYTYTHAHTHTRSPVFQCA